MSSFTRCKLVVKLLLAAVVVVVYLVIFSNIFFLCYAFTPVFHFSSDHKYYFDLLIIWVCRPVFSNLLLGFSKISDLLPVTLSVMFSKHGCHTGIETQIRHGWHNIFFTSVLLDHISNFKCWLLCLRGQPCMSKLKSMAMCKLM